MGLASGTFVRHQTIRDWGVGVVVAVSGEFVHVRFEGAPDEKRFRPADVPRLLEPVAAGDLPAEIRRRLVGRESPSVDTAAPGLCAACGDVVREARFSADGTWKACPECSGKRGEHVYRRCPDAFGTTPARRTPQNPDGVQSHCEACRLEQEPSWSSSDIRMCSVLPSRRERPW